MIVDYMYLAHACVSTATCNMHGDFKQFVGLTQSIKKFAVVVWGSGIWINKLYNLWIFVQGSSLFEQSNFLIRKVLAVARHYS